MEWPLIGINWSATWKQPQISPVESASVQVSKTGYHWLVCMSQARFSGAIRSFRVLTRNCIHYGRLCRDRRPETSVLPSSLQAPRRLLKMALARPLLPLPF
jgi:hypothetical protein